DQVAALREHGPHVVLLAHRESHDRDTMAVGERRRECGIFRIGSVGPEIVRTIEPRGIDRIAIEESLDLHRALGRWRELVELLLGERDEDPGFDLDATLHARGIDGLDRKSTRLN